MAENWLDALGTPNSEPSEVSRFKTRLAAASEMTEGEGRNTELNKTAYAGGQLVTAGLAEERWVLEEIERAWTANGYIDKDGEETFHKTLQSGYSNGRESKPQRDNPIFGMALTSSELHDLPSAKWLLDGVLLDNSFNVIFGEPGSCKSFLTIDIAAHIANRKRWNGHDIPQNGKVVYVLGEGTSGLPDRVAAWEDHHNTHMEDVSFIPTAIHAGSRLWDRLVEYVSETKPKLIVIDTLARMSGNMESENDATSMGKFIRSCDDIRMASGGSVLVVHHSNRMGGMRGSIALDGACDTIIRMDRDYSETVTASITKLKEGETGELGRFRLKSSGRSAVLTSGGVPWQVPSSDQATEGSLYD